MVYLMVQLLWMACTTFPGSPDDSVSMGQTVGHTERLSPTQVQEKASALLLTDSEKVWELIPWTNDVTEAKKLSKETNRPIFLFSMLGSLDGRC